MRLVRRKYNNGLQLKRRDQKKGLYIKQNKICRLYGLQPHCHLLFGLHLLYLYRSLSLFPSAIPMPRLKLSAFPSLFTVPICQSSVLHLLYLCLSLGYSLRWLLCLYLGLSRLFCYLCLLCLCLYLGLGCLLLNLCLLWLCLGCWLLCLLYLCLGLDCFFCIFLNSFLHKYQYLFWENKNQVSEAQYLKKYLQKSLLLLLPLFLIQVNAHFFIFLVQWYSQKTVIQ